MRITEEQQKLLDEFSCERLSVNPENQNYVNVFASEKGASLVGYLQARGWEEDASGSTAYYLIKSPQKQAALFFSLKSGALFDLFDEDGMRSSVDNMQELLQAIQNLNQHGDEKEAALLLLEQYRTGQDISKEDILKTVKNGVKASRLLEHFDEDKLREGNKQIIRVGHTYPGIEIVHFCANDGVKEEWQSYNMGHPMGEVLFWHFVAPIIYKIQEKIGCQYTFLFAADMSEDRTLINYYNVSLRFVQPDNLGTGKPSYDFCCEFMCQEINKLRENRKHFFENFNLSQEDIIA